MKGKKFYIVLAFVLLASACVAAYFIFRKGNGYRSAIPRDAKAVMVVDLSNVAQDLGLSAAQLIRHYDNIRDSGVDLACPVYGFISKDGYLGLVAALSDADDVDELLRGAGFETEARRGMTWATIGTFLLVHDDDKVLLMGPSSLTGAESLYDEMASLMIQGSSESDMLLSLDEQPGDIKYYSRADILPETLMASIREQLPEGADLSTVELIASMRISNRKLTLDTRLQFNDPRLEEYFNAYNSCFRPVSGDLITLAPADPVVWACANVDGADYLELMRHYKRLRPVLAALSTQFDVDQMLNAVDGDVTVSVPAVSLGKLESLFLAQVSPKASFTPDAVLSWSGGEWQTGLCTNAEHKGERLFFVSNSERLASQAGSRGSSAAYRALSQEIVGCVFFASVNLSKMLYAVMPYFKMFGASPGLYRGIEALDRLNVRVPDFTHYYIELTLNEDLKSLLP